nr:unnamed protein product [Callosobruchus chinensis]
MDFSIFESHCNLITKISSDTKKDTYKKIYHKKHSEGVRFSRHPRRYNNLIMGDRASTGSTSSFKQPTSKRRATMNIQDSIQLLQVQGVNLKALDGGSFAFEARSSMSNDLEHQRRLARDSLQRASITGIPSKYLVPNYSKIDTISYSDSTISDSDLMGTPKNTSTPRTSQHLESTSTPYCPSAKSPSKLSSCSSMSVQKKAQKKKDSSFMPGEQAASMLLADELSWKRQNQILPVPINEAFSIISEQPIKNISIGEFFQQNFENMSLFPGASSPPRATSPVPLVDDSVLSDLSSKLDADFSGLSFIQQVIKDTQCTPVSAAEKLLKNGGKVSRPSSTYVKETSTRPTSKNSYTIDHPHSEACRSMIEKEHKNTIDISSSSKHSRRTPSPHTSTKMSLLKETPIRPMSKNSSYTTDHSDNEALRSIIEKENKNTLNIPTSLKYDRRTVSPTKSAHSSLQSSPHSCQSEASSVPSRNSASVSSRSTSSVLTSLPNGRLPIDSDKTELIWGCIKVGKCDTQEFRLRNKSSKKLGLQLVISGQDYKIRKDNRQDSEPLTSFKMLMQPHEVKTITVSFIPTRMGAAVGQLTFTPIDNNLKSMSNQIVKLWGYGGYTKVDYKNLSRDTSGRFWLSLGTLNNSSLMAQKFSVRNIGLLPAFIHLSLVSKDLFKVTVTPSFFALISEEEREITVTYRQTSEDRSKFSKVVKDNMVVDLGTLIVTSGEEVTRGRLRNLCKQSIARNEAIDDLSNILMQRINGEVQKLLTRKEIVLTIEMDPDETIIPQFLDDSEMFQTLYQDDSSAVPKKKSDRLFLSSIRSTTIDYEVTSRPAGLTVHPKRGVVEPGREAVLNVSYEGAVPERRMEFNVTVSCDGQILETTVKWNFYKMPPLICTQNTHSHVDYGIPLLARKSTDYRTCTGTYHRYIPNIPQHFDCRVKARVKKHLLEKDIALHEDIKTTYANEYFKKSKLDDPVEVHTRALPAGYVRYHRDLQERMFANPPKPMTPEISEMKDNFRQPHYKHERREIFGPAVSASCELSGLEGPLQPGISPAQKGYWKYLDIYMTENKMNYIPYTEEQLENCKEDLATYYNCNGIYEKSKKTLPPPISGNKVIFDKMLFKHQLPNRFLSRGQKRCPNFGMNTEQRDNYIYQTFSSLYPYIADPGVEYKVTFPATGPGEIYKTPAMYISESKGNIGTGQRVSRFVNIGPDEVVPHTPCSVMVEQ